MSRPGRIYNNGRYDCPQTSSCYIEGMTISTDLLFRNRDGIITDDRDTFCSFLQLTRRLNKYLTYTLTGSMFIQHQNNIIR